MTKPEKENMKQVDFMKPYDQGREDEIYKLWENSKGFSPTAQPADGQKYFSIVLPPPNVTGTLHLGHARMFAIEDAFVRYHRMKGERTVWVPGTDHAAIATQTVVEKTLWREKKQRRQEVGREKFLKQVEEFAAASQTRIITQTKKMGSSCDWSRLAYTLDEKRVKAVRTAFKKLYDLGLIYRGNRIVNWCTRCASTLSDDEVEYRPAHAKLYWLKYGPFILATARPETKLGDTAVAVHPSDERYKKFVGKKFMIPGVLGEFEITVVADELVDPTFGSGVIKVTPAHDFADFEIAKRHGIAMKQVIGEDGRMMNNTGKYAGLTTKECREQILKDMTALGLIDKIEDYDHNVAVCYRCETLIEPLPKLQWFIDVNKPFTFSASRRAPLKGINDGQKVTLKQLMHQVIESGQIIIMPEHYVKTYDHWINNLNDWCISRQIWFGHRIPAWYRTNKELPEEDQEIYVGVEPPTRDDWQQDEDTLDTWFSSGLWTFSALGWPEESEDFKNFHPTTLMETGYDIIFFWVARMILMSTALLGEIPFQRVYLHGLVRDMKGKKMSKSLGNTIDPIDMIDKYGADPVRFALIIGTGAGTDIRLNEEKIAGYRKFANKIWNAARFVIMNLDEGVKIDELKPSAAMSDEDSASLKALNEVVSAASRHLENYDLNLSSDAAYQFFWHTFADKIIEEQKPRLKDPTQRAAAQYILITHLTTLLKLLHPFAPFVTETIWQNLPKEKPGLLMIEDWPQMEIKK